MRLRILIKKIWGLAKNRFFIAGIVFAVVILFLLETAVKITSTDSFCVSCHTMKQFDESFKKSSHYNNLSGVTAKCVDCHLPPNRGVFDIKHLYYRTYLGVSDAASQYFRDVNKINWEELLQDESKYVFDEGCINCHQNLLSYGLSKSGVDAHTEYKNAKSDLRCVDCHQNFVHFPQENTK